MSINAPVFVPPKTRQWATSAVVLGALVFLLGLQNVFSYAKLVAIFGPAKAMISMVFAIVNEIIAAVFVLAGAAVLKGKSWGREGLTYTSAVAVVTTILAAVWSWITYHDPGFLAALMKAPGTSTLSPSFFNIIVQVSSIMVIVMAAIEITYCVCLYRHMSAEPVEEPLTGYAPMPPDSGAWPPPAAR